MFAALAVAPVTQPASGFPAALILAGGVTALVALVMTVISLARIGRLDLRQAVLSAALGLAVVAVATIGIVAVSPSSAQAASPSAPTILVDDSTSGLQLPTLSR